MAPLPRYRDRAPVPGESAASAVRAVLAAAVVAGLVAPFACNDTPGPPVAPGDNLVNDTMEDAVAHYTQDVGALDAFAAQGIPETGDGSSYDGAGDGQYASVGYADVQSPASACSACNCVGYCLENGTSVTFSGPVLQGYCTLSNLSAPAVGCNPLPAACKMTPTCECVLDAVQPPLGCYPECTTSLGYIDVFCHVP